MYGVGDGIERRRCYAGKSDDDDGDDHDEKIDRGHNGVDE